MQEKVSEQQEDIDTLDTKVLEAEERTDVLEDKVQDQDEQIEQVQHGVMVVEAKVDVLDEEVEETKEKVEELDHKVDNLSNICLSTFDSVYARTTLCLYISFVYYCNISRISTNKLNCLAFLVIGFTRH